MQTGELALSEIDGKALGAGAMWLSITGQLFAARMAQMLMPYGLTTGQLSILSHMANARQKKGQRVSDIATAVEVGQPAVTKALAKFQNLGLVTMVSNTQDQRSKYAQLTEPGFALLGQIRREMAADMADVFSTLDAAELAQFTASLQKVGRWLDEDRA